MSSKTPHINRDFFICAAGFEDRTLGCIENIKDFSPKNSIIFEYRQTAVETPPSLKNEKIVEEKLSNLGGIEVVELDPSHPTPTVCNVLRGIFDQNPDAKISIDISTMSRYLLLILLRGLHENNLLKNSQFFYTEPKSYNISKNRPLSLGTREIEIIPTFGGYHHPRHKSLLVMFLGYEGDRSFTLWEKIEPHKCVLLIPSPSYNPEWEGVTENINRPLINAVGENFVEKIHSTNPIEVHNSLKKIISKHNPNNDLNVLIAPLGTKPQSVGAFLYCLSSDFHPTVIYSWPKKHTEYSDGIGKTYEIEMPKFEEN
ncbi:hypothetical protein [Nitrosopumilus sp.]|uniref:hypothetical protein n=1 Tax=Nitrosopumilus sp. TaxID=2024843 RepID=UPI003D0E642F